MVDYSTAQKHLAEKTLDYVAHVSRVQRPADADNDLTYIPARALMIGAVVDMYPVMKQLADKLNTIGMTKESPLINNETLDAALEIAEVKYMRVTGIRLVEPTSSNIDNPHVAIDVADPNMPTFYVPADTPIGTCTSPYDEM